MNKISRLYFTQDIINCHMRIQLDDDFQNVQDI
jgi:hypothetical protein